MGLSKTQFNLALKRALIEHLREGDKVPSLSEVSKLVDKTIGDNKASPTYNPPEFVNKKALDLNAFNNQLKALDFDLSVVHEFLFDVVESAIKRSILSEVVSDINKNIVFKLQNDFDSIAFILKNTDYFYSIVSDSFSDLSKVNQDSSTKGIVNIKDGSVSLPEIENGLKVLQLDHLLTAVALPFNIVPTGRILSSAPASDAPVKNLFSSGMSSWRHTVVTDSSGPCSLSFDIPLSDDGSFKLISKIRVGFSDHRQNMEIEYSQDNVNFISLSNSIYDLSKYSDEINFDFEPLLIKSIRITLYKTVQDSASDSRYAYTFSLNQVQFYTVGRSKECVFISKPFKFDKRLSEVYVTADESLPSGTDIKYYVGVYDSSKNKEVDGTWQQIAPLNRSQTVDPKSIKLNSPSKKTFTVIPASPITKDFSFRGVDYFNINSEELEETIDLDSVKVLRGKNAWRRERAGSRTQFPVVNSYISFASSSRQKIYAVSKETVSFGAVLAKNGANRTTIEVSRPVDYRQDAGLSMVAPKGQDPYSLSDPIHAIYEVTLVAKDEEYSENITFGNNLSKGIKFTSGPIKVSPTEEVVEFLTAYDPVKNYIDEQLILALHGRPGLSGYYNRIVRDIKNITSPAEVASGLPNISRITIGNSSSSATPMSKTIEGEILTDSTPLPKKTNIALSSLNDEQLLGQFGRLKIRSNYIVGIVGYSASSANIYHPNSDFVISVVEDPVTGAKDVYITPTPTTSISAGETVAFKFKYKTDLTENVHSVVGNRIYLDKEYTDLKNSNNGFRVKVGYRFVPVGNNEILSDTVKAYSSPNLTDEYKVGVDYSFNIKDGSITILRSALANSPFYVSYTYEGPVSNIEVFTAYLFVENKEPFVLEWNDMEIDPYSGEKVVLIDAKGVETEITSLEKTDLIKNGTLKIVVYSRSPDVYSGSAIYKVASLTDKDGAPIFLAGGKYFNRILATTSAMSYVPLSYLKNNIGDKDKTKFSISGNKILVNFQPDNQQDFFTFGFISEQSSGSVTNYNLAYRKEEFIISYNYIPETEEFYDSVVLKAHLLRSSSASPSITPKLNGYSIRVR